MRCTVTCLTLLLAAAIASLGGCKGTKSGTPQEAFCGFVRSIDAGDKALFLNCADAGSPELTEALFDYLCESSRLQHQYEKAYGSQRFLPFQALDANDLEKRMIVSQEAHSTVITLPPQKEPFSVLKKNSQWKVDLLTLTPKKVAKPKLVELERSLAVVYRAAGAKIGRAGATAQSVQEEVMLGTVKAFEKVDDVARELASRPAPQSQPTSAPVPLFFNAPIAQTQPAHTYTVLPGETLTTIATKVYGPGGASKYMKIYQANKDKMASPNAVVAGTELVIPPP